MLRTAFHFLRLARAGFVLAREGVFSGIDDSLAPPAGRAALGIARRLERKSRLGAGGLKVAITRLGPSYIKLGQFLATRPDVVGMQTARSLESLQDRVAPFAQDEAIRTIETAFDRKLGELFVEFGEPVAAASIAQVHKAKVVDASGERDVAVKVLRPGVERRFARDLSDMFFAARLAERHFAEARRLRLVEVVETLARTVRMEMDFRLEAAAASEFEENCGNDPDFRLPKVDWDRTARPVLTLEWIDGTPLSDSQALAARGVDLPALGRTVIQSFLRHALRDGFFHADMHQGNLFLDREGRLAAVDFGIMGRLGLKERRFLAEILYGFITRNYRRVAEVHFEAGYVPAHHNVDDFAQAIRAIGEPIHSRTADQISMAKLLTLLFEITALFDMKTRTELVLLQKTMVVVEGVARGLDPRLDMWNTADPVVRDWMTENLGPVGRLQDIGRGLASLGRIAGNAPDLFERTERLVTDFETAHRNGLRLSPESVADIGRAEARRNRWGNAALWVIAALLAVALFLR